MVSFANQKYSENVGFNIDTLLSKQTMSVIGNDFTHNADSAFTNLKPSLKDLDRSEAYIASRDGFSLNITPSCTGTSTENCNRDSEYCSQCFETSPTNIQDNLLNSMRSYSMSTQNLTSLNNINSRNLIRSAGLSSHPWSLIDSSTHHVSAIPSHEIRSHSNLGNLGLKFHNGLVQLDNITGMQNLPSIANNYPSFTSLYSSMGQGQIGSQIVPSRADHGVAGPAYSWTTSRGAGFLTSRCPDSGLFMPSYRKPKRVRTAFSPTQLLRLEHAFEKNHYVVGQERKELSASLNLSETQVKVWFQNRRTKHKRMQTEEEMASSFSKRMPSDCNRNTPSLEDVVIDA